MKIGLIGLLVDVTTWIKLFLLTALGALRCELYLDILLRNVFYWAGLAILIWLLVGYNLGDGRMEWLLLPLLLPLRPLPSSILHFIFLVGLSYEYYCSLCSWISRDERFASWIMWIWVLGTLYLSVSFIPVLFSFDFYYIPPANLGGESSSSLLSFYFVSNWSLFEAEPKL